MLILLRALCSRVGVSHNLQVAGAPSARWKEFALDSTSSWGTVPFKVITGLRIRVGRNALPGQDEVRATAFQMKAGRQCHSRSGCWSGPRLFKVEAPFPPQHAVLHSLLYTVTKDYIFASPSCNTPFARKLYWVGSCATRHPSTWLGSNSDVEYTRPV